MGRSFALPELCWRSPGSSRWESQRSCPPVQNQRRAGGSKADLKGSLGFPGRTLPLRPVLSGEDLPEEPGTPQELEVNNNRTRQHIIAPVSG